MEPSLPQATALIDAETGAHYAYLAPPYIAVSGFLLAALSVVSARYADDEHAAPTDPSAVAAPLLWIQQILNGLIHALQLISDGLKDTLDNVQRSLILLVQLPHQLPAYVLTWGARISLFVLLILLVSWLAM